VHGCTGGATGAGFGLLFFDWRTCARRTLVFRAWPRSPCRYWLSFAGLPLQQTAEGKKSLTRQVLALDHSLNGHIRVTCATGHISPCVMVSNGLRASGVHTAHPQQIRFKRITHRPPYVHLFHSISAILVHILGHFRSSFLLFEVFEVGSGFHLKKAAGSESVPQSNSVVFNC
jgi:hypothetical protein